MRRNRVDIEDPGAALINKTHARRHVAEQRFSNMVSDYLAAVLPANHMIVWNSSLTNMGFSMKTYLYRQLVWYDIFYNQIQNSTQIIVN